MASATQDRLYEVFVEIAGDQRSSFTPVVDAGREMAGVLKDVTRQIAAAAPAGASSGGGGVAEVLERVGSAVLKNALGAAPLIRGIVSLFGGGGDSAAAPAPLVKHVLPAALHFTAATDGAGGFRAVDYDQAGMPRAFPPDGEGARTAATPPAPVAQQVTVHVQAMDARSFMDRSTEIAAAVREAMLNLNSINDVVSDL